MQGVVMRVCRDEDVQLLPWHTHQRWPSTVGSSSKQ